MAKSCPKCREKLSETPERVVFPYEGLGLSVLKNGFECASCKRKEYEDKVDKYSQDFIGLQGPHPPEINWQMYIDEHSDKEKEELTDILLAIGILSIESKDSWEIVDGSSRTIGLNLGLPSSGSYFYFKRKKDALQYACLIYDDHYKWEARHIGEVVSRDEALFEKSET